MGEADARRALRLLGSTEGVRSSLERRLCVRGVRTARAEPADSARLGAVPVSFC